MDKLHFFDSIAVRAPVEEIYNRLGYRQGITQVSSQQREEIETYIDQAEQLLELKGAGRRITIKSRKASKLELSRGVVFESKLAASVFESCQELLLFGATAGSEVIEVIGNSQESSLTRGVVFDAVASETVDSALAWIQNYFRVQLQRENKQLYHKRISCGYGDFLLSTQKTIYELLQLKKIGVSINDKYILSPEKSVTAVGGVIAKS